MGRKKPGKPRRPRTARAIPHQSRLQELQPPGPGYDEWIHVQGIPDLAALPGFDLDQQQVMNRLREIAPIYQNVVPMAAITLDDLIATGNLPVLNDGETGSFIPVAEMAAAQGLTDPEDVRRGIHELHANGMLLIGTDTKHDVSFVRVVFKRPDKPGDRWVFMGDEAEVPVATTCVPTGLWDALSPDVAMAVMYLRTLRSQLEDPDPAKYAKHNGVGSMERAQELFTAAEDSGWIDYKGCDACPTGHLCTRTDTA